ncbi:MAG: hypothetical protein JRS35_25925 [Deltaproteobacteria bacterium]|nr:hypothetical protein [Deltaproteobacteria bacterium]
MRTRAIRRGAEPRSEAAATRARRPSVAGLVFLRGRDADGRLRELVAERAQARPVLGALAAVLLGGRGFEPLGFRCLGDWSRERIGVGARTVREWARVWRALEELPRLRGAVLAGEVSWTVARLIVGIVTPENEAACLETVRGRTVRAVGALLRAVALAGESPSDTSQEERVPVRVACSPRAATKWAAALELARRMAGEELAAWECAEAIAAECASAVGSLEQTRVLEPTRRSAAPGARERAAEAESGLRAQVWPPLRWNARPSRKSERLARLTRGFEDCSPRELDRRLRAAIAFLQEVDFEIGRILRQVVDRKLYRELGFESFERYVQERLDLSPRTARRLVRLARAEHTAPAVASAFREGRLTLLQAEVLLRGGSVEVREHLELALRVTLRRLQDEVLPQQVAFWAPPEVAALFEALVSRLGFEAMLDHAIATWLGGSNSMTTRISNGTVFAARFQAARRGATCRAITSGSARHAGRTWRGIGRRCVRFTTIAGCTPGAWRFAGGRPMVWSTRSAWGGSGPGT